MIVNWRIDSGYRHTFYCLVSFAFSFCILTLLPRIVVSEEKASSQPHSPNILYVVADDLGFSDLGCYGGEIESPVLDRLATNGIRLTQFYTTGRCCPSRASILTGRHPVRVDITDWIPGMATNRAKAAKFKHVNDRDNLALSEITIAEELKANGYQTAMFGKIFIG